MCTHTHGKHNGLVAAPAYNVFAPHFMVGTNTNIIQLLHINLQKILFFTSHPKYPYFKNVFFAWMYIYIAHLKRKTTDLKPLNFTQPKTRNKMHTTHDTKQGSFISFPFLTGAKLIFLYKHNSFEDEAAKAVSNYLCTNSKCTHLINYNIIQFRKLF